VAHLRLFAFIRGYFILTPKHSFIASQTKQVIESKL